MSNLKTLTLPYKGTIPRPLLNYIEMLKERNREDQEVVEYLNTILQVALVTSSRLTTSK